jgi:hypothetical protein
MTSTSYIFLYLSLLTSYMILLNTSFISQLNYTLPKGTLMVEVWIGYVLMHFKMFNNMAANQK